MRLRKHNQFNNLRKMELMSWMFFSWQPLNIARMLLITCGLMLSIVCLGPSSTSSQPMPPESDEPYITELEKLGYLQGAGERDSTAAEELRNAVIEFQTNFGLPVSGDLDQPTKDQMLQRRCGNPDKLSDDVRSRMPRFAATSGWGRNHITWNIVNYTQDLPREQVDDSIERAFKLWSDDTVLSFERIDGTGDEVDVRIDFSEPYTEHGDNLPFDGPGHVLAHAFLPWFSRLTGDVHFDDGETWTHKSYSGANLWLVAAHEIGHSLGLQHSFVQGTLMYPYHSGFTPDFILHEDDILGIEHMYGDGMPDVLPTQQPGPPNNPLVPKLCMESFDSIDVAVDGYTYVFKGDYYWRLDLGQIVEGYPQLISQGWPGLQSDIDAALTVKNSLLWREQVGKTFFFKGRAVWRYTANSLDAGYPQDLSVVFPGFPDSIQRVNGAIEISGNGQTFFLADGVFYLYTWRRRVEGPYSINAFRGLPANLAGAVQLQDNYIYFFTKDLQYFQVSPWTFSSSYGYPRLTNEDWFGCEEDSGNFRIGTEPTVTDSHNAAIRLSNLNLFKALCLFLASMALL